jgi:hypothetical protein
MAAGAELNPRSPDYGELGASGRARRDPRRQREAWDGERRIRRREHLAVSLFVNGRDLGRICRIGLVGRAMSQIADRAGFPDEDGNFPDRRFKFPARPQKIPCSDA